MNVLTGSSFGMLERSVDFLWTKQTAILDNIANVETPNYKVKTVTFEEAFEQKLLAAQRSENPRQAVRDVIENVGGNGGRRVGSSERQRCQHYRAERGADPYSLSAFAGIPLDYRQPVHYARGHERLMTRSMKGEA